MWKYCVFSKSFCSYGNKYSPVLLRGWMIYFESPKHFKNAGF